MPTEVIMPQLGESVVEGTVAIWLKSIGDNVEEFEPIVEVSTDKVTSEIPSPASGTLLEIYVQEDETVTAGTVLAVIGAADEAPPHKPSAQPAQVAKSSGNGHSAPIAAPRLSPVVARMVAEHNLDISQISGTGRGGRITKKDVQAFLQSPNAPAEELSPWETPGSGDLFKPTDNLGATSPDAPAPAVAKPSPPPRVIPTEPIPHGAEGEVIRLSPMRKAIAKHMVESKLHTSPHVTTVFEADMSHALAHRAAHKDAYAKAGINLTLTAYFMAAIVQAVNENPIVNSQWTDEGVYQHYGVHIGMAVAVSDGLIVPVIRHAERLNLRGLSATVNDLAERGRNGKLSPDEVTGGTITLTNHGVSGSLFATPIINQPQAAIVGVGMMEKRVKVIDDAIAIRPCCYISLTFDHRILDGATGDAFMVSFKRTLESGFPL